MKNSLLAPLILGGAVIVAVGAYAGTRTDLNPWQDYAKVVAVAPAFDNQQTARQACNDEAITQQLPIKDEKRVAGTVAGGYAGNKVQKHMQEGNFETVVEQRCGTVYDNQKIPAGFDVTYLLDGKQSVVRMDYDPGQRIRVENGELDLSRS